MREKITKFRWVEGMRERAVYRAAVLVRTGMDMRGAIRAVLYMGCRYGWNGGERIAYCHNPKEIPAREIIRFHEDITDMLYKMRGAV